MPAPVSDDPEDLIRRDLAAISRVAGMYPANTEEAHLAAQYVAASAHALDCLRLAGEYATDITRFKQCGAQAAHMMREARGWRNTLQRAQAEREAREASPAVRDAALATERRVLGLLAEALDRAPAAKPAEPPPPDDSPIAQAEHYALHHRKRARLIRRFGGVPHRLDFGPLSPELVHTIATGTTPILCALDDKPGRAPSPAG